MRTKLPLAEGVWATINAGGSTGGKALLRNLGVGGLAFLALVLCAGAAVPAPEKILPDDTLVLVTAPDFGQVRANWKKGPQAQFWNDPAMKPFAEKFLSKWNEDLVKPLERDLGIKFADYAPLFQGQITLALRQISEPGNSEGEPGVLLLIDAKDKGEELKH